jgi:hypothetical protein
MVYMIALRARIKILVEIWVRPIDERMVSEWNSAVIDPMERLYFWVNTDDNDLFQSVGRRLCHERPHRQKEFALDAFAPSLKKMLSDSIHPLDDSIEEMSSKDIVDSIHECNSTSMQEHRDKVAAYAAEYYEP